MQQIASQPDAGNDQAAEKRICECRMVISLCRRPICATIIYSMEITGLTTAKAVKLHQKYGPNIFSGQIVSAWSLFLRQFNNSIVYLLSIAGVVAFITSDLTDGFVITFVLVCNTFLGFFQEYRTEKTLEKLTGFLKKHIIAIRDGRHQVVDVSGLVPGDVVLLKNGDIVPADCTLLSVDGFLVNESQLTGESEAVEKKVHDQIYSGSVVEKGEARAEVKKIAIPPVWEKLVPWHQKPPKLLVLVNH